MADLRRFEKRLDALSNETPSISGGFNALKSHVVKAIFLLSRVTGRAHPTPGMRVLPRDWRDREEMCEPVFDKVRELGEREWDIFYRRTHTPLKPEWAKECEDRLVNPATGDYKPLSYYEARYSTYPHVTEAEKAWCSNEAFWAWFDERYPEEPRCEL